MAKTNWSPRSKLHSITAPRALANVDDSKLGDTLPFFGGRTISRGGMMMNLSAEFADHYSMAAMYLRLNGLLPPTAKK